MDFGRTLNSLNVECLLESTHIGWSLSADVLNVPDVTVVFGGILLAFEEEAVQVQSIPAPCAHHDTGNCKCI